MQKWRARFGRGDVRFGGHHKNLENNENESVGLLSWHIGTPGVA